MSFSFSKIGKADQVAAELRDLVIQDALGSEIRDVLVRHLPNSNPSGVLVKAHGHADANYTNLTVSVESV